MKNKKETSKTADRLIKPKPLKSLVKILPGVSIVEIDSETFEKVDLSSIPPGRKVLVNNWNPVTFHIERDRLGLRCSSSTLIMSKKWSHKCGPWPFATALVVSSIPLIQRGTIEQVEIYSGDGEWIFVEVRLHPLPNITLAPALLKRLKALSEDIWSRAESALGGEPATLHLNQGIFLTDGDEHHRQFPETFSIPSKAEKINIRPGMDVRIGLEGFSGEYNGRLLTWERFWTRIDSVVWPNFTGTVKDGVVCTSGHGFRSGDSITFHACHILNIDPRAEELAKEEDSGTRPVDPQ